jgi:hypothetical protein
MAINWAEVWAFVWPILRQGLVALLVSILALLEYDKIVPSRYARRAGVAGTPEQFVSAKHRLEAKNVAGQMVEGLKLGKRG